MKPLHQKKYHTDDKALQSFQNWTLKWIVEHSLGHPLITPYNLQYPQKQLQILKHALWLQDVTRHFPDEDGQHYRKIIRHHIHT